MAETAQARFQQATQASGESLEDWADRVLTLATKAFKTLPEHYSSKQAVVRFCEGLLDREAGLRVGMDKPANIEQAINSVRWYQHLQQSVYGKSSKRDQRKQEESYVKAVQETRVQSDEQSSLRISSLEQPLHRIPPVFFDPVYWIFHKRTVAGAGTTLRCLWPVLCLSQLRYN